MPENSPTTSDPNPPSPAPAGGPLLRIRLIGARADVIRGVDALRQVLDVRTASTRPRKNRRGHHNEPGVRAYIEADHIRDVDVRELPYPPAPPVQGPGYVRLVDQLQALPWYPLRAGDVVTVDRVTSYGGRTYLASAASPAATSFCCPRCGRSSQHPGDIVAGYCGLCHDWTGDEPVLRAISPLPGERATTFAQLWFDAPDATITVIRGGRAVFVRVAGLALSDGHR